MNSKAELLDTDGPLDMTISAKNKTSTDAISNNKSSTKTKGPTPLTSKLLAPSKTDAVDGIQKDSGDGTEDNSQLIDNHFQRSLGESYSQLLKENPQLKPKSKAMLDVDEHFAKALGNDWETLNLKPN